MTEQILEILSNAYNQVIERKGDEEIPTVQEVLEVMDSLELVNELLTDAGMVFIDKSGKIVNIPFEGVW